MPSTASHAPLILFFDCFIVSSAMAIEDAYRTTDPRIGAALLPIRSGPGPYRHAAKLAVVKYTLLSYNAVPWDEMVLRVECEDEQDRADFFAFARRHFPFATIVNQRSATATAYLAALAPLARHGNPWIFFSPNNDHPLLGKPDAFGPLLQLAEELEPLYPNYLVSVLYSHFTESQNTVLPDQHEWGQHSGGFSTVLGETAQAHVIEHTNFVCDSIKIYRLQALLAMFERATNQGRCIRLEDTGLYLSKEFREISVYPKVELCRHFDSYTHLLDSTPPLFIPDGFFESAIRIRYGYPERKDGYVNVNPFEKYSYRQGAADLRCRLSELPAFWNDRIASVDTNPDMTAMYGARRNEVFQFGTLRNPYSDSFVLTNYMRSAWKAAGQWPFLFDEALCQTFTFTIPAERAMIDHTNEASTAVYFVLAGVAMVDDAHYSKHDLVIFQGDTEYALEAVGGDARVLKVLMAIGGPPNKKEFNWADSRAELANRNNNTTGGSQCR